MERVYISPAPAWQRRLAPFRVGFWRAAGEAILGWGIIGILSGHAWWQGPSSPPTPRDLFVILAGIWVFGWPMWRMRQAAGRRWWSRVARGIGRLGALATVFTATIMLLSTITGTLAHDSASMLWQGPILFSVPLAFFRLCVLILMAIGAWIRSRIYRQLMVSHLAVIMITFVGLIAIGVVGAIGIVLGAWPDARTQAILVADALPRTEYTTTLDRAQAQGVLDALRSGRIHPNAINSSPLPLFAPWRFFNYRMQVLDSHGRVIAAVRSDNSSGLCAEQSAAAPLPAALRNQLMQGAMRAEVVTAPVPANLACDDIPAADQGFAAAAVYATGPHTQPLAVVVVQGRQNAFAITQGNRIFGFAIVSFGFATILVLAVTVLPTLAISSLAALVFARGVTRRLLAVSQAAAAIADGDLSQRAPVNAHNEIGRLAQDFNRMAAYQEHAIADLQQARAQAEQALRARQELVASVSHELRTPIAIVQAHLDTLQMEHGEAPGPMRPPEEILIPRPTLEALRHELDRLAGLVDDLFALARVETGALQLHLVPTDVRALVREVTGLLRPLAQRESAITMTSDMPPSLPLAMVDADRLRQILANLVRNAIRHTPEGGIIALTARVEGPWVTVSVADTGEGIPSEHLPHIFDRFYRVDQARSRASGGAGLGLAIVREFVEGMGGRVTVESVVGEGTCFHVYLARAEVAREDEPIILPTAQAAPRS